MGRRHPGSVGLSNREKLREAQKLRTRGLSLSKIAEQTGTPIGTVKNWSAAKLLEHYDPVPARQVLEELLADPAPNIRLGAARVLYAMDESATAYLATTEYDEVEFMDGDPPDGQARPYARLQVWQ